MTDLPDRPARDSPREPLQPQRLTSEQFEQVIRRAAEMQARSADEGGADGLSDEEALRIGQELGLSGAHLGMALAEVRSGAVPESGVMVRLMGKSRFTASRAVPGEAGVVTRELERYLVEHEYLVVQRRLADRTVFARASGMLAAVARTTTGMFRRSPLLGVETLDVAVRGLEDRRCFVGLSTDLSGERTGHFVGGTVMGGLFGGLGALSMAIAVGPVAALVAVPILAGSVGGMRYAYRSEARKVMVQLEALLDRLEHGDLMRA